MIDGLSRRLPKDKTIFFSTRHLKRGKEYVGVVIQHEFLHLVFEDIRTGKVKKDKELEDYLSNIEYYTSKNGCLFGLNLVSKKKGITFDEIKKIKDMDEEHRILYHVELEFIKKYPDARIVVEGHTCSIGHADYNQRLSENRALAVERFMIEKGGIREARIMAVGYGESRPIASNKTRAGRARNRRVEILIKSE